MTLFDLEAQSSMLFWYPKVVHDLPTPKTHIYTLTDDEIAAFYRPLDGKAMPKTMITAIQEAASQIGYPLFMRTDQASGKHEWDHTCYVPDEASLIPHVISLIGWHTVAGIMGVQFEALIFREFLNLDYSFRAFKGMPVAKERRYFVRDGVVECHHPYWPEDSIKNPSCEDWRDRLALLDLEKSAEVAHLTGMARRFGAILPGYWSVDFACDTSGKWWLIDAARGELSFHIPECQYCPDEIRKQFEKRDIDYESMFQIKEVQP